MVEAEIVAWVFAPRTVALAVEAEIVAWAFAPRTAAQAVEMKVVAPTIVAQAAARASAERIPVQKSQVQFAVRVLLSWSPHRVLLDKPGSMMHWDFPCLEPFRVGSKPEREYSIAEAVK